MKFLLIIIGLGLVSWLDRARAVEGRASVSVSSQSKVSYLYRDRKYATWFKCWGGPDTVDVSTDGDTQAVTSADRVGSLEKTYRSRLKPGFTSFTPNQVSWNSDLSSEGDFTVEFKQTIVRSQTTEIENACSNQSFHSKLDELRNSIDAVADFIVPDGVYVVRIKKDFEEIQARTRSVMEAKARGLSSMDLEADRMTDVRSLDLKSGDYQYFFVKPGDQISMRLTWQSTELNNAKVMARYQIRMMGTDGCGKYFGKLNAGEQRKMADWVSLLNPDTINADPHGYIERVSCVRNKEYINSLIYGQHGQELISQLRQMYDRTFDWEGSAAKSSEAPKFGTAIRSAAYMSILEVSRILMEDLHAYCTITDINDLFVLPKGQSAKVRGYVHAARIYGRLRYLLSVIPRDIMKAYVDTLGDIEIRQQTYAVIDSNPRTRDVIKHQMATLMEINRRIFPVLRQWVTSLPAASAGGARRSQLPSLIDEAGLAADDFLVQMRTSFLRFANRDSAVVETKILQDSLSVLDNRIQQMESVLKSDFDWFLGQNVQKPSTDAFLEDMQTLNTELIRVVTEILEKDFGKRIGTSGGKDFLDMAAARRLFERTQNCLKGNI